MAIETVIWVDNPECGKIQGKHGRRQMVKLVIGNSSGNLARLDNPELGKIQVNPTVKMLICWSNDNLGGQPVTRKRTRNRTMAI